MGESIAQAWIEQPHPIPRRDPLSHRGYETLIRLRPRLFEAIEEPAMDPHDIGKRRVTALQEAQWPSARIRSHLPLEPDRCYEVETCKGDETIKRRLCRIAARHEAIEPLRFTP